MTKYKLARKITLITISFLVYNSSFAEADYISLTMDNDLFVGSDDGYTNGMYYSWYYVDKQPMALPEPGVLVKPLLWSLPDQTAKAAVNAYSLGQAMVTPEDITTENPDPNDLPYSGLLALTNSYLLINDHYADKISTSLGIVGPESGAAATQKFVHEVIDSDKPRGWDSQLDNELVFQFSRSRIWRSWVSESGNIDVLTAAEISIGTLESVVGSGAMIRTGSGLERSYPSPAFINSRTTNPLAISGGWFAYLGIGASYVANQIFTDGNTYRDSRSVELDHTQIGGVAGFSYSWDKLSITLAIEDLTLFEEQLEGIARFGTFTVAWRL